MFKVFNKSQLNNTIAILIGTRPGIIKMSPLIQEVINRNENLLLIHAGQHYSYEMDAAIINDIGLPVPHYHIEGVHNYVLHGEQTAEMLKGIEKVLVEEKPRCILVCGDANTNLAGALAARKLNIEVGHVEAGLRSRDWRMPEEHNRVMIDHISEYLFAPTPECVHNLKKENVLGCIFETGNTIVDATNRNRKIAEEKSLILNKLNLERRKYMVLTSHREENVDNYSILNNLLEIIEEAANIMDKPVVFPMHPRTRKNLINFGLFDKYEQCSVLCIIPPLGYLDFLHLLNNSDIVMTDSGGIQEEACILGIPCLTLRENTERPESIAVGANVLVGTDKEKLRNEIKRIRYKRQEKWSIPFGDGKAAAKIIDAVQRDFC